MMASEIMDMQKKGRGGIQIQKYFTVTEKGLLSKNTFFSRVLTLGEGGVARLVESTAAGHSSYSNSLLTFDKSPNICQGFPNFFKDM